jgi:PAS domain S-box-containing protein
VATRYLIAMGGIAAAIALKMWIDPMLGRSSAFLLLLVPVALAAWYLGAGPALAALALAAAGAARWFLPPYVARAAPPVFAPLSVFLLEALALLVVTTFVRRSKLRTEETEERYATTLGSIGDAVIATDHKGRIEFMNHVAEEVTGWTFTEAAGRDLRAVFMVVDAATHAPAEDPVARVLRARTSVAIGEHTLLLPRRGPARIIEDSGAPIHDRRGGLYGVVLVFRDVTARRRAEDRRRFLAAAGQVLLGSLEYEQTLQRVANLMVPGLADWCAVYLADGEGKLASVAVAHSDPQKQVRAREVLRRHPPDPERDRDLYEAMRSRAPRHLRDIPPAAGAGSSYDDEERQLLEEMAPHTALVAPLVARGRSLGVLVLVFAESGRKFDEEDVTMAADLARSAATAVDNARLYRDAQNAVRARDEFLSIASHELKTPLTPLQLQLDTLRRALERRDGGGDPGRLHLEERLETATRQTLRLSRLVESLLDVSRITSGRLAIEPEPLDLGEMAAELVERFQAQAASAGSPIAVRHTGRVDGTWDRLRLEQVVSNLLSNAIKYGAGKPIEVAVEDGGDLVRLVVRDGGIGIAAEDVARVFGRFERAVSIRRYGGLGLGLYIARQIVEAHGGQIVVHSQIRRGAAFTVILPRHARLVQPANLSQPPQPEGPAHVNERQEPESHPGRR